MTKAGRNLAISITTALAVLMTLVVSAPASATTPPTLPWTASATTTVGRSIVAKVETGATTSAAVLVYDNNAPVIDWVNTKGAAGTVEFRATAATTGTIPLMYDFSGFHAYYKVKVGLEAFVRRGTSTTKTVLVDVGPVDCCTPPSGGFTYTGTTQFQVKAGDIYGFKVIGSNYDSNARLSGRLAVKTPPPPAPEIPGNAVLMQAVPTTGGTRVAAQLTAPAGKTRTVELLTSSSCIGGQLAGPTVVGSFSASIGASGEAFVTETVSHTQPIGVYAAVRLAAGATKGTTSRCVVAGADNDSWTRALHITDVTGASPITGYLDSLGNSRWYRFNIQPGARATVDLTSLPDDYDLALFTDISQAFVDVDSVDDLDQLGAEFSPSVFSPSVFSPSVFSPSVFSPDAYSPSVFSPSVFSPSVFSPSVFSPSVFSPSVFSPSVFSPSVFSPSVFSPSVFSPSVFSPSVFSPSVFSPENFASAQSRSLIAVAAQTGTGDESIVADTWNNTGQFYVRVTGKNGQFDLEDPFSLAVTVDNVDCSAVVPMSGPTTVLPGTFKTIILHDRARLAAAAGNDAAALAQLETNLAAYAARPEVAGVIVDLGAYPHIQALRRQAQENSSCPYAENLSAAAIKQIVDDYRVASPGLEYVTIVGNDSQVPFFRYPDQAQLGPEQDYDPPVQNGTQSQSALRLNYVLGQDEYGSSRSLALQGGQFPLPDLAVGRLVESAADMNTVLTAYLGTAAGVVDTPTSTLVTGYDFLADAADAVQAELVAGTAKPASTPRNDKLITASTISPQDPRSWTADQLRTELLDEGDDVVFLAGHFSANSTLAADYSTTALATELEASDVDLTNSIVFSAGCHAGYNIVDGAAVPGVTEPLDWTQAFARKGATLVAGTGYQYGDTDFIEYSERLYVEFAKELRRGEPGEAVSVGQALIRAKQAYLASTPDVRGLHRKSVLISTVFGLPNLKIVMPGARLPDAADTSSISPSTVAAGPGAQLGLKSAPLHVATKNPDILTKHNVDLTNLNGGALTATYLSGPDGVVTNPAEPTLPLIRSNVTVSGQSLRGVGFLGGAWSEEQIVPLTGAPTTELRGVHTPFTSTVNFPMRLATPNYLGGLTDSGGTVLNITPAQHRVANVGDIPATLRRFNDLDFELFYSNNVTTYGPNTPALSAPPTLTAVDAVKDGADVVIRARVVGDPAAGIQKVWATYTNGAATSGVWTSIDLAQTAGDSTLWTRRLVGAASLGRLDYMVQAVNGVGLVTLDDNFGAYYSLQNAAPTAPAPTTLTISAPAQVSFGDTAEVTATLTSGSGPVAGAYVVVAAGGTARAGITGADGVARVQLPITATAGTYTLTASYAGSTDSAPSSSSATLDVDKVGSTLALSFDAPAGAEAGIVSGVTASLSDAIGTPLLQRTVYFTVVGPDGTSVVPRLTDNLGRAKLGPDSLPGGLYSVTAQFLGTIGGGVGVKEDPVYEASAASLTALLGGALVVPNTPTPVGVPVTLTVKSAPSTNFGPLAGVIDWGDGTSGPLDGPNPTHVYMASGEYRVTVRITDAQGRTTRADAVPLLVEKVASHLTLSVDAPAGAAPGVVTGVTALLGDAVGAPLPNRTVYFTIVGPAGTAVVAAVTDAGGHATLGPDSLPGGLYSVSAQFLGTVAGVGNLSDPFFQPSTASVTALIGQALVVPETPTLVGAPVTLTVKAAPATNFGALNGVIDWGDGTTSALVSASPTHVYATDAVYQISVRVTDAAGRTTRADSLPVVVYKQSTGFAAGVGHFTSAPGAYVDVPLATGMATFGFLAVKSKTATAPSGGVAFQIRVAGFTFRSTKLDQLVVTGASAELKGKGTVSGSGAYDFTLNVTQAQPSLFRLQVWDRADGRLVYDTQRGAGATGTGVPLQGGVIKVQK